MRVALHPPAPSPSKFGPKIVSITSPARDSFVHITWLVCTCDMTHMYVCHNSFTVSITSPAPDFLVRVTWSHSYVCHDSYVRVTRLIRRVYHLLLVPCNITHIFLRHSYVWHGSYVRATWLIFTCVISLPPRLHLTFLYVKRDSLVRVTWIICSCDLTHTIWLMLLLWLRKKLSSNFAGSSMCSNVCHDWVIK